MPLPTAVHRAPAPVPEPLEGENETTSIVTRGGTTDAALLRVSVQIARDFPRNEGKIIAQLRETLAAYPQFAEKALYSIPYQDRRLQRTVHVEGLSIRAAETLAAAWGNLRVGVRITGEDEAGIDLEAVVFDMERNLWELAPARVLKTMKTREGRVIVLDERSLLMARGAAVSKVKRNAVLAVMPLHLKAFFEAEVRRIMAGGDITKPAAGERVERAFARFEKDFKVTREQLETYVGKPATLWIGNDIADLQALYNALEQGETTVAEAFHQEDASAPASPNAPVVIEVKDGQLGKVAEPPAPEPAPEPEPKPAPKPRAARAPKPEPAPAPSPAPSYGEWAREIAQATTIEALDQILGRVYLDAAIPRDDKRAVLGLVTTRRDALQAQG